MFTVRNLRILSAALIAALLAASLSLSGRVSADSVITVTSSADNTTSDGFCTLREAIENANNDNQTHPDCSAGSADDQIVFGNALGIILLNSALPIITDVDGLTINGGGDITVSGADLYQVFNIFPSASLSVQNLTVKNGKNNNGGGISNVNGTLTITNSTLDHNTATTHGGGIFNTGTLVVIDSTFSNNSATSAGGAIISQGGTVTITGTTFTGNSASAAGGVYKDDSGTLTITNSTFTDNTSTNNGGGIYSTGTTTITNSTFSSNGAGISGSSIYYMTFSASTLSLYNNILANSDTSVANCTLNSGTVTGNNNLIEDAVDGCGFTDGVNGNILGKDPKLGALANNGGATQTMSLGLGSPAINAGASGNCPAQDQRGITRPQGPGCDIGAFEAPIPTPTFSDVPTSHWAWLYIERLYNDGITGGCSASPLMYCPESYVNRAQMAIFILRAKHGSSYSPPAATGIMFADVPASHWAAAWIEQLANEGVTTGCGGGNFCPEATVTRDQMAIFLLRSEHGSAYTPPVASGTMFADVPSSHWAAKWIEQLANEGITGGCGGGNYCPNVIVTRDQMAVFLVKAFGLP